MHMKKLFLSLAIILGVFATINAQFTTAPGEVNSFGESTAIYADESQINTYNFFSDGLFCTIDTVAGKIFIVNYKGDTAISLIDVSLFSSLDEFGDLHHHKIEKCAINQYVVDNDPGFESIFALNHLADSNKILVFDDDGTVLLRANHPKIDEVNETNESDQSFILGETDEFNYISFVCYHTPGNYANYPYRYTVRLNNIINVDANNKIEEVNNDMVETKKAVDSLVSTYDTVHVTVTDSIHITYMNMNYFETSKGVHVSLTENLDGPDVSIYPNPTTEYVNIECNSSFDGYTLRIVEVSSGKVVFLEDLNMTDKYTIETSSFNKGLYLLTFDNGVTSINRKLIVR